MGENDDIIKEFIVESHENIDRLDNDLVALEKDPSSKDILARIFRATHTIKGTCGFFGFSKLQTVTHAGENLLARLRDGQLALTAEMTTALLAMVDVVRELLSRIENTGAEGDGDYAALIATLGRLAKGGTPPAGGSGAAPKGGGKSSSSSGEGAGRPPPGGPPGGEDARGDQAVDTILEAAQMHAASAAMEGHIRVDVGLLDKLMTLVGELVLARNQILQFTAVLENGGIAQATQRLNLITTELQESVMKMRMQPIGKVWNKFPRVVRDLAAACGKNVHLEMEGEGTELDKTLIEAIADPLTHAVRNAVDHGIETPAERRAAGKPAEGRLALRAFHESGHVNIEISDDGAGIDVEKVKNKALSLGLLSPDQAPVISDREAMSLIFLPGFSTAEKVTNLSGRGVGMDVVKTNIERIGGSIDVQSARGKGMTLKIKIPLTLAIIPALIVSCRGDFYAIPQASLMELVRLDAADAGRLIERIHGVPVYRLRGRLLPLVNLGKELFGTESSGTGNGEGPRSVPIVVLQAGDHVFGLIVDAVNDTEEIVVKPLGQQLKGLSVYAGASIMGDGRVALILDVLGIALKAHVLSEVGDRAFAEDKETEKSGVVDNRQSFLLFRSPDRGQMAIPLSAVARLEEFPRPSIERAGSQDVVQYRGEILPLLNLSTSLPERRSRPRHPEEPPAEEGGRDVVQVVVYTRGKKSVGLMVERILDIVEEALQVQSPGTRSGVTGSAVIHGRVTELLDVENLIRGVLPEFFGPA
jgi:two-component system chemotaxis sensor kinase CheA